MSQDRALGSKMAALREETRKIYNDIVAVALELQEREAQARNRVTVEDDLARSLRFDDHGDCWARISVQDSGQGREAVHVEIGHPTLSGAVIALSPGEAREFASAIQERADDQDPDTVAMAMRATMAYQQIDVEYQRSFLAQSVADLARRAGIDPAIVLANILRDIDAEGL